MKASRRHLSSSSSRRLDQDEYIRLSYMSSEDVFVKNNTFVLAIPLQDTFKTFSRRFQDVLPRRLQNSFNPSCKNVFKTSSRRLQNVFKTFSRRLAKMSSRRFEDVSSDSKLFA